MLQCLCPVEQLSIPGAKLTPSLKILKKKTKRRMVTQAWGSLNNWLACWQGHRVIWQQSTPSPSSPLTLTSWEVSPRFQRKNLSLDITQKPQDQFQMHLSCQWPSADNICSGDFLFILNFLKNDSHNCLSSCSPLYTFSGVFKKVDM